MARHGRIGFLDRRFRKRLVRAAHQFVDAGLPFLVGIANERHLVLAFKNRASIAQPNAHKLPLTQYLHVSIKYGRGGRDGRELGRERDFPKIVERTS